MQDDSRCTLLWKFETKPPGFCTDMGRLMRMHFRKVLWTNSGVE